MDGLGGWNIDIVKEEKQVEYYSSVLRCHDPGDDECKTCRFLSGDRSEVVLMSVIALLDKQLAGEEGLLATLQTIMQKENKDDC